MIRLRNRFSLQLQNFHFSTVLCVLSSFSVTISHICFKMTSILFAALLLRPLITCNCDHTCVAPVCSPVSHQRPLYFSPRAATARARLMCVYRLRHTFCANTRAKFSGWLFGYFLLVILVICAFIRFRSPTSFIPLGRIPAQSQRSTLRKMQPVWSRHWYKDSFSVGGVKAPLIWINVSQA